jgi:uncharacterized protein (DUF1015 family)
MLKPTTEDTNSICSDDELTNETVVIKEKKEIKKLSLLKRRMLHKL